MEFIFENLMFKKIFRFKIFNFMNDCHNFTDTIEVRMVLS